MWNLFIVNIKGTRKTSVTTFWCLVVNIEQISHIVLLFPLLTLNNMLPAGIIENEKLFRALFSR